MQTNQTSILMPSATHAIQAKKLFEAMGYRCIQKRTVRISKDGCSHYIIVNTDFETASDLLTRHSIPHGEILRGSGDIY